MRSFSVELKSKKILDKISIQDDDQGVLIEGNYGELCCLSLQEDKLLEIKGSDGIFRIELSRSELCKLLNPEGHLIKSAKYERTTDEKKIQI